MSGSYQCPFLSSSAYLGGHKRHQVGQNKMCLPETRMDWSGPPFGTPHLPKQSFSIPRCPPAHPGRQCKKGSLGRCCTKAATSSTDRSGGPAAREAGGSIRRSSRRSSAHSTAWASRPCRGAGPPHAAAAAGGGAGGFCEKGERGGGLDPLSEQGVDQIPPSPFAKIFLGH